MDWDPWERSYRIVLNKLKVAALPVIEAVDPEFLRGVIYNLFLIKGSFLCWPIRQMDKLGVSEEELASAARKLGSGSKVPGPDGIPVRV